MGLVAGAKAKAKHIEHLVVLSSEHLQVLDLLRRHMSSVESLDWALWFVIAQHLHIPQKLLEEEGDQAHSLNLACISVDSSVSERGREECLH